MSHSATHVNLHLGLVFTITVAITRATSPLEYDFLPACLEIPEMPRQRRAISCHNSKTLNVGETWGKLKLRRPLFFKVVDDFDTGTVTILV